MQIQSPNGENSPNRVTLIRSASAFSGDSGIMQQPQELDPKNLFRSDYFAHRVEQSLGSAFYGQSSI
jgi:hypothetical protein